MLRYVSQHTKDKEKLIEYGRLKVFTVQSKSAATTTGESAHPFPSYSFRKSSNQEKRAETQTTAAPSFYDHRFSLSRPKKRRPFPWRGEGLTDTQHHAHTGKKIIYILACTVVAPLQSVPISAGGQVSAVKFACYCTALSRVSSGFPFSAGFVISQDTAFLRDDYIDDDYS